MLNYLVYEKLPIFSYWEAVSNLLWIRLDQVMSMHNESVKALDIKKMQPAVDTRPHYVRFPYFC